MNFEEMDEIYQALATIKSMCKKQKLCNMGCPLCVQVGEENLECVLKEFVKPECWKLQEPPVIRYHAIQQRAPVISWM